MNIRPVSDLRNKFPEIENELTQSGSIYFTKNGYGVAVLMDINSYTMMTNQVLSRQHKSKKSATSKRGFLRKYANPDLIQYEKDAARLHIMKKYEK